MEKKVRSIVMRKEWLPPIIEDLMVELTASGTQKEFTEANPPNSGGQGNSGGSANTKWLKVSS